MAEKSKATLFCLCAILFLHSALTDAQEVLDEREFDYMPGSRVGPARWGTIRPEWATCNTGNLQSPIDMSHPRVRLMILSTEIRTRYRPGPTIAHNRGHDIMLEWVGGAGEADINGTVYNLRQVHWHSPSEHTIDGRRYDMELHMVHTSQDPNAAFPIAVLGGFYEIGAADPFLAKLMPYLRPLLLGQNRTQAGVQDANEILINSDRQYYRYVGSLTVPPCTEGVLWTIKSRIMTVSREQIRVLRDAVHDSAEQNARPLQPTNDRPINLFLPLI